MTFPKIGTRQTPVNNRPSSYNNGTATVNFTFDNTGNMTAAGATTYQWDGANRLKSVNGGTSGSYGFDGNGKRVKKTEGGASTYYVYSSVIGSAVMEVTSAGVQRAYVMNGGSVVAQRNPDGNFYWLHADHLGSGRKMTNASGNLTYRAEFDPYGKLTYEWSATPNQNTKKFTGYERDAGSGLDYAQARMYGSEWGRFLSPDPAGLAAARMTSPKSLNRYTYTEGNPVNYIDPGGLGIFSWFRRWLNTEGPARGRNLWEELPRLMDGSAIVDPVYDESEWFEPVILQRSPCGSFVDEIIALATAAGSSFGEDFKAKKTPTQLGTDLLYKARDHARALGNQGWGGFHPHLIAGNQNDGVFQHIVAHAGAWMIGEAKLAFGLYLSFPGLPDGAKASTGTQLSNLALEQDRNQLANPTAGHTAAQAQAEIAGDLAGRDIGHMLGQYLIGNKSYEEMSSYIQDHLCENSGN